MNYRINLPEHSSEARTREGSEPTEQLPFFGDPTLTTHEHDPAPPLATRHHDALIIMMLVVALASVGGLVALSYTLIGPHTVDSSEPLAAIALEAPILEPDEGIVRDLSAFSNVTLGARSAVVLDTTEDTIIFAREADAPLPLASVGKLMTAYTALKVLGSDAIVPILPGALATEGDSGLIAYEEWRAQDLAAFMLMTSSNDAAQALAAAAGAQLRFGTSEGAGATTSRTTLTESEEAAARLRFVEEMNAEAGRLGMRSTRFRNATGLDTSQTTPGSEGSARDATRMLVAMMREYPDVFEASRFPTRTFESRSGFVHQATNTNGTVGDVPGMIGSKTGFTDLAGGNLAVAVDAGVAHPLIIVVLGSTFEERFSDVETLTDAARSYLTGV